MLELGDGISGNFPRASLIHHLVVFCPLEGYGRQGN